MTTLADIEWRFIREETHPGPLQMALDEVAAETAASEGLATVRVYRWEPSTLSLGYRQAPETVDWEYCERHGIDVTRRQTGGGGIYHDSVGDISYSIVAPAATLPGDLMESYDILCLPILAAFERMGIDAGFATDEYPALYQPSCYLRGIHPAHDILVDSRKISGNAQYRQRDAVVQHGSLSYAHRESHHLGVFENPAVSPETFRERVTAIARETDLDRPDARLVLERTLLEWINSHEGNNDCGYKLHEGNTTHEGKNMPNVNSFVGNYSSGGESYEGNIPSRLKTYVGNWTEAELERAQQVADLKYTSDAWNRRRVDPTSDET